MKAMWWSLLAVVCINNALIGSERGRHKLRGPEDFVTLFADHGKRKIELIKEKKKSYKSTPRTITLLEQPYPKKRTHTRHTNTKPTIPKILPLSNPQRKPNVLALAALLEGKRKCQQSITVTPNPTEHPRIEPVPTEQKPVNIFTQQPNSSCQFIPRVLQLRALEYERQKQDYLDYLTKLEEQFS
jgi:hypothetical protein